MSAREALLPPPGTEHVPAFDAGWRGVGGEQGASLPFLRYVDDKAVNWSEELEDLHEQSSRQHFIDVWTRRAMLAHLGELPREPLLADIGCSSGYLLDDLRTRHPDATLIGIDMVASGLRKAHARIPQARLAQADACALPLRERSLDAALSANLLEHLADDTRALAELRRVLRPGARAVVVVPSGPRLYDYYDRFLGHERRYARGELARKAHAAGLQVILDTHVGVLLYPAFWLVKKRNRHLASLRGEQLRGRVARDIVGTEGSLAGKLALVLEQRIARAGVPAPFGIRGLTVLRRPEERT
ncbi:MAG TPA: class I SAM-dependent methyltransferase [Solirubrobacteraceae bacterium]|jgi:SAM-dependent methyltransferase|nr:class I SAM-dependent methyltransferase [Solirubrobacteraceae bacterium]